MPFSLKRAGRGRAPNVFFLFAAIALSACQPTVRVEAPKEPIVINLNVKIEQEVRVKVERDVEDLIESESDLF